jgi:hypothetical protein
MKLEKETEGQIHTDGVSVAGAPVATLAVKYLFSDDDRTRERAKSLLMEAVTDPAMVENCITISDTTSLKREGRIIMDALEAVSNGMYEPYTVEKIAEIDPDSVFAPWRYVIEAIAHFYNGEISEARSKAKRIPLAIPPRRISDVLIGLCDRVDLLMHEKDPIRTDEPIRCDHAGETLIESILDYDGRLVHLIGSAEALLEADAEEEFTDSITLLIQELKEESTEFAVAVAVFAMQRCWKHDLSTVILLENLQYIFGACEANRIVAVAMEELEPGISVLYWIKAFDSLLANRIPSVVDVAAFLSLIFEAYGRFTAAETASEEYGESFEKSLATLLSGIAEILHASLSDVFPPVASGMTSDGILRSLLHAVEGETGFIQDDISPGGDEPRKPSKSDRSREMADTPRKGPVQLELFTA